MFYDAPRSAVKGPGMPLSVPAVAGCALAPGSAGWGPGLSLQPVGRMAMIWAASRGLEVPGLSLRYKDNTCPVL